MVTDTDRARYLVPGWSDMPEAEQRAVKEVWDGQTKLDRAEVHEILRTAASKCLVFSNDSNLEEGNPNE